MGQFVNVGSTDDILPGTARCAEVGGRRVCLVNVEGEIFAIDDICTHAHAHLSEGDVSGDEIACPLHFATFNVRTGACTGPPATEDVATYRLRIEGTDILVEV